MKIVSTLLLAIFCAVAQLSLAAQTNQSSPVAQSPSASEVLDNESVIQLKQIGLGDSVIIEKIKMSRCTFNVSISGLKQLKSARISDDVIAAMLSAQAQMNQNVGEQQAQVDKSTKEGQPVKESVEVQQPPIEHAASAERDFRSEIASDNAEVKLVGFHATSGLSYYETNLLNSSVTEHYKLNFEAEIEYEVGRSEGGLTVNPGDRTTYSGTMNGTKTELSGGLASWQFRTQDLQILGGSNPSLTAALKANEEKAKAISDQNTCINNLRQVDGAIQQWALMTGQAVGAMPTWNDLKPYIGDRSGKIPSCPLGGTYTLHPVGLNPGVTCSVPGHVLP